jgi:hypothetical protein
MTSRSPGSSPTSPRSDTINISDSDWTEVLQRIRATLRRSGLSRDDADDVTQEVVARALERGVIAESADDFMRWAWVVARNLSVDVGRRQARLVVGEIPDRPVQAADVRAHDRLALAAVTRAIESLSESDREALEAAPPAETGRTAGYLAVRRHRIRRRLEQVRMGFAGLALRLRVWRQDPNRVLPVVAVLPAALGVGALAVIAPGAAPEEPSPRRALVQNLGSDVHPTGTSAAAGNVVSRKAASPVPDTETPADSGSKLEPRAFLPIHPRVSAAGITPNETSVAVTPTPGGPPPPLICSWVGSDRTCVARPEMLPPLAL